jgi:hypothetical protein
MRSATRVGWAHKEMEKSKQAKKGIGLICLLVFKSVNISQSAILPSECTNNFLLLFFIGAAGLISGTAVLINDRPSILD